MRLREEIAVSLCLFFCLLKHCLCQLSGLICDGGTAKAASNTKTIPPQFTYRGGVQCISGGIKYHFKSIPGITDHTQLCKLLQLKYTFFKHVLLTKSNVMCLFPLNWSKCKSHPYSLLRGFSLSINRQCTIITVHRESAGHLVICCFLFGSSASERADCTVSWLFMASMFNIYLPHTQRLTNQPLVYSLFLCLYIVNKTT